MRPDILNINSTETLDYVCDSAMELSNKTEGQPAQWKEQELSLIFAKMVLSCIGFLKFIPDSSWFSPAKGLTVWDVGSAASICRNLMEAYYSFVYVALPAFPEDEPEFKQVLWEYHDSFERHTALSTGLPQSGAVGKLEHRLSAAREKMLKSSHFQSFSDEYRKQLLKGKDFKLLDNVELSRRAGIHPNYFRMQYKCCSGFAHTAPFSISLMNAFNPGSENAKAVIRMLVATVCVYMCFGARDFTKVFLLEGEHLNSEFQGLIQFAEEIARWEVQTSALDSADRVASGQNTRQF